MTSVDAEYTSINWDQLPIEVANLLNSGNRDEASKILTRVEDTFKRSPKPELQSKDFYTKVIRELVQTADLKKMIGLTRTIIDLTYTPYSFTSEPWDIFQRELIEKGIKEKNSKYLDEANNLAKQIGVYTNVSINLKAAYWKIAPDAPPPPFPKA